jgi:hypothetical protein
MMSLIKLDLKAHINEQLLQNLISFIEIQFPPATDGDASILNE